VVDGVGGVGIDYPEGVECGAKKRFAGGDVERENVIHPLEPGEYGVIGKKRHMNVGRHTWLPNCGKEGFETIKGRKVSLVDRGVVQMNHRGVGGGFFKRLKQGKKNIQAPRVVMLNDGKKCRGGGQPLSRGRRRGTINHDRDEPDVLEVQGKGLAPPGGEGRQSRE